MDDDGRPREADNPGMVKTRVVLANDPRAYREIIGSTIQALRPHVDVLIVEPESLDSFVASTSPDLVIGSKLTAAVRNGVRRWVDLYPDGEQLAIASVDGRRSTLTDVELSHLLEIVDITHELHTSA